MSHIRYCQATGVFSIRKIILENNIKKKRIKKKRYKRGYETFGCGFGFGLFLRYASPTFIYFEILLFFNYILTYIENLQVFLRNLNP